jgi:hypothetical protein
MAAAGDNDDPEIYRSRRRPDFGETIVDDLDDDGDGYDIGSISDDEIEVVYERSPEDYYPAPIGPVPPITRDRMVEFLRSRGRGSFTTRYMASPYIDVPVSWTRSIESNPYAALATLIRSERPERNNKKLAADLFRRITDERRKMNKNMPLEDKEIIGRKTEERVERLLLLAAQNGNSWMVNLTLNYLKSYSAYDRILNVLKEIVKNCDVRGVGLLIRLMRYFRVYPQVSAFHIAWQWQFEDYGVYRMAQQYDCSEETMLEMLNLEELRNVMHTQRLVLAGKLGRADIVREILDRYFVDWRSLTGLIIVTEGEEFPPEIRAIIDERLAHLRALGPPPVLQMNPQAAAAAQAAAHPD